MKTNNSETSLLAYANNVGNFANREQQVLDTLRLYGPMTSNELFERHLRPTFPDKYRHNTHARLSALRDLGLVYEQGKRVCEITGETVIVWAVTPPGEEFAYQKKALAKKLEAAEALAAKLREKMRKLNEIEVIARA